MRTNRTRCATSPPCIGGGRGVKQDDTKAIRWYRKAAEAGDTDAMQSIGNLFYDRGVTADLPEALKHYRQAMPYDYAAMRIWLCHRRLGKPKAAAAVLKDYRDEYEIERWPASVMAFLMGEITAETLLRRAKSDEAETQNEHQCEAYFYIGSVKLFGGDKSAAASHFEKCVKTGVTQYAEYDSAKAELVRLKGK